MYPKFLCALLMLTSVCAYAEPFLLGVENIPEQLLSWLSKKHVGLLTNQSGKDQQGRRSIDLLLSKNVNVKKILAPEHGIKGAIAASVHVPDALDEQTQLPIVSLYGHGTGKKIDPSLSADIDVFIVDIQDVGMRHFTYISTLLRLLEFAAEHAKQVVVCDRPNPLGSPIEGPGVEPDLISFISAASIPLRHGMTIGEVARYFNTHVLSKKAELCVVPMKGYTRSAGLPDTVFAHISPNILHKQAAHGYSFLGLLGEIRPFDIGMGTDKVFTCICLPDSLNVPDKKWQELKTILNECHITASPYTYYNTRKKQQFRGLEFKICDINSSSAWRAFLTVIAFFKAMNIPLSCSKEFDKAAGIYQVRQFIEGSLSLQELESVIHPSLNAFIQKARQVHLY